MIKTVLDLLPESVIETWHPGSHILVVAGTGRCKTTWVKQVLWPFCKKRGLTLYALANRSMLRDDIRTGTDMPVLTYQLLEQAEQRNHPAWDADVIVLDECHSLATDVLLDCRRNKILKLFHNPHTIIVGLTATPVACVTKLFDQEYIYQLPRESSHLAAVYVFHREEETQEILMQEMDRGGRVLCFVSSAARGLQLHRKIIGTSFICSRNARQWTPQIEEYKKTISSLRNWGEAQALIATKVMDVGVSIEDENVTSVIVETTDYTVDLIQMIGRIRCANKQSLRIFVRAYSKERIDQLRNGFQKVLQAVHLFECDQEEARYGSSAFPLILRDGSRNELAISAVQQMLEDLDRLKEIGASAIVSEQLCNIKVQQYKRERTEKRNTCEMIRSDVEHIIMRNIGIVFYNKHDLLKQFETFIAPVLQNDVLRPSRKNVQAVFHRLRLPYSIERKQESRGALRGKYAYFLKTNERSA